MPMPWFQPYMAQNDDAGYVWTGSISADHVARMNEETGEWNFYLLPAEANIRHIHVQRSEIGGLSSSWVGMLVLLNLVDARTPVALFALGEGRPHQHSQSTVVARMRRFRARARRIEAAGRDVQRPTKSRDRELGLLRRNPGKRHAWCLAKKAAAFFRMSRSIRSSRFSLRSRASSVRSSSSGRSCPGSDPPAPAAPNCPAPTASDRARGPRPRPSNTSRTAPTELLRELSSRSSPCLL